MEHAVDRRQILTMLLAGDDVTWHTLDTVRARIAVDAFGDHGWTADPGASSDPRSLDVVDLFRGMELLDPREPAFAWNQAGLLCDLGRYAEGADEFLQAASKLEAGISEGWIAADEAEWIEAARAYAAQAFLLAGQLVTAAVIWTQLTDDDYREDVRDKIEDAIGDAATAPESFDWLAHPRWQEEPL